jgi:hypothetical protein
LIVNEFFILRWDQIPHLDLGNVLIVKGLCFCCQSDFWGPQYRDLQINYA